MLTNCWWESWQLNLNQIFWDREKKIDNEIPICSKLFWCKHIETEYAIASILSNIKWKQKKEIACNLTKIDKLSKNDNSIWKKKKEKITRHTNMIIYNNLNIQHCAQTYFAFYSMSLYHVSEKIKQTLKPWNFELNNSHHNV